MSASATEPQRLGPYRLAQRIGEGGMGVVYLAVSPDGDLLALKVLRPWLLGTGSGRARVAREVTTLQRVRGPRVAEVIDADVAADPPYVVTRYIPGPSLDKVVADHGPLRGDALRRLARGLAEALVTVHAAGVVHRDVKPGNVLLHDGQPVLIDFGLARALDETRLTATGMVIGTAGYLAPETVEGRPATPETDVHGWAATVAFAATGRPPFGSGPDPVVLDRIRRGEYDLAGVAPPLADLLVKAMAADPASRPAIGEVQHSLAEPELSPGSVPLIAAEPDVTLPVLPAVPPTRVDWRPVPAPAAPARAAPAPPPAPAVQRPPSRMPVVAVLGGLGALLVAVGLAAPYVGLVLLAMLLVVARAAWRGRMRLQERRMARGPQRSDGFYSAVGAPWHALMSTVPTALQLVVLLFVGLTARYVAEAFFTGPPAPLVVAGVVVVLVGWFGPGARRVRRGGEMLLGSLGRHSKFAWAVAGLLFAAAWAAGMWWESYGTSTWPLKSLPPL